MMTDNEYFTQEDAAADRDQAIEDRAEQVIEIILDNDVVFVGDDTYTINDFLADVEIDEEAFIWSLKGAPEDFQDSMNDKLSKWCEEIATKLIDQGE